MKPPVQTVVTTPRGRDQLINLKRHTGVPQWNIIMRWAVCASLREETPPPPAEREGADGDRVSVDWETFAGDLNQEITSAFWMRHASETSHGTDQAASESFKRHLQRGLNILEAKTEKGGAKTILAKMIIG
jgi:DNA sulfur modification protein DndE